MAGLIERSRGSTARVTELPEGLLLSARIQDHDASLVEVLSARSSRRGPASVFGSVPGGLSRGPNLARTRAPAPTRPDACSRVEARADPQAAGDAIAATAARNIPRARALRRKAGVRISATPSSSSLVLPPIGMCPPSRRLDECFRDLRRSGPTTPSATFRAQPSVRIVGASGDCIRPPAGGCADLVLERIRAAARRRRETCSSGGALVLQ
jgi:hypothetical protein